jgi:predicted GIY-YIG superfamily endonuclease
MSRVTPELLARASVRLATTKAIAKARNNNFIYVIGRQDGPVKVGVTSNPQSRLGQIRTGCPFHVELLHAEPMLSRAHALQHEADFHAVYEEKRLNGEWFDIDAELAIELIETGLDHESWFQETRG